jgi:hypothetical protein
MDQRCLGLWSVELLKFEEEYIICADMSIGFSDGKGSLDNGYDLIMNF